jgi:hypothetical protein
MANVEQDDVGTLFSEFDRVAAALTPGTPGHQNYFVLHASHDATFQSG